MNSYKGPRERWCFPNRVAGGGVYNGNVFRGTSPTITGVVGGAWWVEYGRVVGAE
jgi:hypothetical protein